MPVSIDEEVRAIDRHAYHVTALHLAVGTSVSLAQHVAAFDMKAFIAPTFSLREGRVQFAQFANPVACEGEHAMFVVGGSRLPSSTARSESSARRLNQLVLPLPRAPWKVNALFCSWRVAPAFRAGRIKEDRAWQVRFPEFV